jgi:pyruvate-formate lyase-activating enzyme
MNVYHITYSPDTKAMCIFFAGCNFSCKGCIRKRKTDDVHLKTPTTKKSKKHLKLKKVLEYVSPLDINQVIFLGGEPTIDTEFSRLAKILQEDFGTYNILITNGHLLPDLAGINEICLSIKAVTPNLHQEFTSMSNKNILSNFKYLSNVESISLRAESIFIPEYIDLKEIEKIAKFIASCNTDIPYRIDGYYPVANTVWRAPKEEELIEAVKVAHRYLKNVTYLSPHTKLKHKVIKIV